MNTGLRKAGCRVLLGAILTVGGVPGFNASPAAAAADGDWPDWADGQEELRQRIDAVNDGDLAFIAGEADTAVHHHASRITISERSLVDGWVLLEQCHDNLDRVESAQIVFRRGRSRGLEVVSSRNVASAVVQSGTVQLAGIGEGSQVCLRLETHALQREGSEVFELHNGPFMRRFLDGYYPLRLSMRIDYPASLLLADFAPEVQPGFAVTQAPGTIGVEAYFEGRLRTRFRFLLR